MSYLKQHELGLAGLALLRNWFSKDKVLAQTILDDILKLVNLLKISDPDNINVKDHFDVITGYKKWSETYDKFPNLLIEVEEPAVKSLIQKITPGRTLDAACGTGRYSNYLNSLKHIVTGIDQSPEMLLKARQRNKDVNFIQADLNDLPFKNESFDLAVCTLVLTHFMKIHKPLSELSRVVRVRGCIIISDIHPLLVTLGGQAEFYDKNGKWGYITNYTHLLSEYLNEFNNLGLKVIQCIEPKMKPEQIKLAQKELSLNTKTVFAAFDKLPIALVWVLERT